MARNNPADINRPFGSIAAQLENFNRERQQQFGRGPLSDERLPLPFTMVGADLPDEEPRNR